MSDENEAYCDLCGQYEANEERINKNLAGAIEAMAFRLESVSWMKGFRKGEAKERERVVAIIRGGEWWNRDSYVESVDNLVRMIEEKK